MHRFDTAPADGGISDSAQEDEARERANEIVDDQERAERWDAFTARAIELGNRRGWDRLLTDAAAVIRRGPSESQGVEVWLAHFADSEGWPDTIAAIGHAWRAASRTKGAA